ncbi:MAG: PEP-CTERM sorting domain-containing protein [Phycisphaerales bacterium JB041]
MKAMTVCACGLVASAASIAAADIAFNNYGPDNGGFDYNWGIGWTVAGPNNGSGQFGVEQALSFTAEASGELTSIWVPVWRVPFSNPADEVTVHLATYIPNTPPTPADVLESWTLIEFPSWSDWSMPHQLDSAGGIAIEDGTTYWIWMEGGDTTWCGWAMVNDPRETTMHTLRRDGEEWLPIAQETASGLRVDVVPAPGGLALLGLGFGAIARRRRG